MSQKAKYVLEICMRTLERKKIRIKLFVCHKTERNFIFLFHEKLSLGFTSTYFALMSFLLRWEVIFDN